MASTSDSSMLGISQCLRGEDCEGEGEGLKGSSRGRLRGLTDEVGAREEKRCRIASSSGAGGYL